MHRIGIDIGGTFTDVVLIDEDSGEARVAKLLTDPERRGATVVEGISSVLAQAGAKAGDLRFIAHGTTIATNAVLERKGARTALIGNTGFRDILEIGRFNRPAEFIYRIQEDLPKPLVPRRLRLGVDCRVNSAGQVVRDADEEEIRQLAKPLREAGVESLAVSFLFSFLNPGHEQQVREVLAPLLEGVDILLSSEIQPEFREFPRTSTTVFAAYVAPVLRRYLKGLLEALNDTGIDCPLYVFQSNGGVARPEQVNRNPATTLLSGPAGAVMGAVYLCGLAGFQDFITFDMGGTSLDVCLVREGSAQVSTQREIDHFPVVTPMVDVHTVGAGGGSVITVDEVGRVHVGPHSMGAHPGPACYNLGGERATVTDVNVLLGYLEPSRFAGGQMTLEKELAESAMARDVAEPLGLHSHDAAIGAYAVANHQMAEAIRYVSVERGHDPRDFSLIAFGGGGPVHAVAVARELGIPRVVVPRHPGLFSARGIAMSDFTHHYMLSILRDVAALQPDEVEAVFSSQAAQANTDLEDEGIAPENRRLSRSLDMRYVGQTTEINVPIGEGPISDGGDLERAVEAFHREHEQLYSYAVEGEPVEVVNVRLQAVGLIDKPHLPPLQNQGETPRPAGERQAFFEAGSASVAVPVYRREDLPPGATLEGPAMIEELSSTTVVPPGTKVSVDEFDNLILEITYDGSQ